MKSKLFFIGLTLFLFNCKSAIDKNIKEDKIIEINYYDNGFIKSIGQIDSTYYTKAARVGFWCEFYENGKLKSAGEFKTSSYVNCCIAGPCNIIYCYKTGNWCYYFENGNLKAKGVYEIKSKWINTSCDGGDEINFGFVTKSWIFYDKKGSQINPSENDIKEIEDSGIINEFDMI